MCFLHILCDEERIIYVLWRVIGGNREDEWEYSRQRDRAGTRRGRPRRMFLARAHSKKNRRARMEKSINVRKSREVCQVPAMAEASAYFYQYSKALVLLKDRQFTSIYC